MHQSPIRAISVGKKRIVSPLLDDSPFLQHYDVVGFLDSRQPMSNDNRSAPVGYFFQSFLDNALAGNIECACSFIKNQNFRVLDNASRDCDSLPLPAT